MLAIKDQVSALVLKITSATIGCIAVMSENSLKGLMVRQH